MPVRSVANSCETGEPRPINSDFRWSIFL